MKPTITDEKKNYLCTTEFKLVNNFICTTTVLTSPTVVKLRYIRIALYWYYVTNLESKEC